VAQRGQAQAKLAISDADSPAVHIYDARSGSNDPVASVTVHRQPVQVPAFAVHICLSLCITMCLSCDVGD